MKSTAIVKPKDRPIYSSPLFQQTLQLNSLQAQRVMDRSFEKVSHSLFFIDVVMHIIGNASETEKVAEIILGHLEKVKQLFDEEAEQMDKLMADNGIDSLPIYDHPVMHEIKVNSPQLARFTAIIKQLDVLAAKIDTLWLNNVLSSKQRVDANKQWQQRVIKLANRIIGIESYAKVSAKRMGKQSEVNAQTEVQMPMNRVG